ncbi:MAG: biopolymer transporter ExbD [Rhodoferax sp.]|nr:biopolymer transporter ExbD [Rhodoferax sp.]
MAINFETVGTADGLDGNDDAGGEMLSEINTTPLVDVMLVLLIIFLITIPVVNAAVAVKLPQQVNQLREALPETVIISVDAAGTNYWFDAKLGDTTVLREKLVKIASLSPQPEVHIRADARTDYAAVAKVVLACQQAGIARIGFLTEAPP